MAKPRSKPSIYLDSRGRNEATVLP